MDFIKIVNYLVPDVQWLDGVDNSSKQSVINHYYSPSGQPFPTDQEGLAALAEIEAAEAAEAAIADEMADLDKANAWLTNQITPFDMSVADRTRLRDILLRMYKYLKYGQ